MFVASDSSAHRPGVSAYARKFSSVGNDRVDADRRVRSHRGASEGDDFPFKVESWNHDRSHVACVLALTTSGGTGHAAYYAAICLHPDRYITLRRKGRIILRSR